MNLVLFAFLILGGLGLVFGGVLAFASRVFAVEVDPREEAIAGCLPGANCGGCGYPGCGGYAAAVVKGRPPSTSAPPAAPPWPPRSLRSWAWPPATASEWWRRSTAPAAV